MAFKFLNFAQKEEDPEAYEPEFVVQHRKKTEHAKIEEELLKLQSKDPLFDMDDDLDELSQVSERYPVQMFHLHKQEDADQDGSGEQQRGGGVEENNQQDVMKQ